MFSLHDVTSHSNVKYSRLSNHNDSNKLLYTSQNDHPLPESLLIKQLRLSQVCGAIALCGFCFEVRKYCVLLANKFSPIYGKQTLYFWVSALHININSKTLTRYIYIFYTYV